jgi:bacillithiol biosynthesis cysteine-adding enzyme BshC
MEITSIPFEKIPQLSFSDIAYANGDPKLREFYAYEVGLNNFEAVIADKQKEATNRAVLAEVLREQYARRSPSAPVFDNIESLTQPGVFTITTAHQPCLLTGPLFYHYKIASTIHLSRQLTRRFPQYRFVPIFINGAEDHDFEEINHFHLFNRTLRWDEKAGGPVGELPTHSLRAVLEELRDMLGDSENAQRIWSIIEAAYANHTRYGDAAAYLSHELYKDYGLVVLDMGHRELKRLFAPLMKQELIEQPSKVLVENATLALEAAGFSGQAHAREINLFYLTERQRARIVEEAGRFHIIDTPLSFSRAEIIRELEAHPECFSPNVILRPLYQEFILPNLAYIGGGGELAYWLERKRQFAHFGVNFPMLIRRTSLLWIDGGSAKRLEKLGLRDEDIFQDTDWLIRRYVEANTSMELSLEAEKTQLSTLFDAIVEKAERIDKTLVKTARAEEAKALSSLDNLESKLLRAEKQRHDIAINQIKSLKDKLFPGGALQERHDNFLSIYLKHGEDFFRILTENLDPLMPGFLIIRE